MSVDGSDDADEDDEEEEQPRQLGTHSKSPRRTWNVCAAGKRGMLHKAYEGVSLWLL